MAYDVRILWIHNRNKTEREKEIARMLDEGWVIVAGGGGASDGKFTLSGFVVLQRDIREGEQGLPSDEYYEE